MRDIQPVGDFTQNLCVGSVCIIEAGGVNQLTLLTLDGSGMDANTGGTWIQSSQLYASPCMFMPFRICGLIHTGLEPVSDLGVFREKGYECALSSASNPHDRNHNIVRPVMSSKRSASQVH